MKGKTTGSYSQNGYPTSDLGIAFKYGRHAIVRMLQRYSHVISPGQALDLYIEHRKALLANSGEKMFKSSMGGTVFRLEDSTGNFVFPVLRKDEELGAIDLIVTYLTEEMVYQVMVDEDGPTKALPD